MHYIIDKQAVYPVGQHIFQATETIEQVVRVIRSNNLLPHDCHVDIFCRGSSGSILAALLVGKLSHPDISIVYIRKENENSHSAPYVPYSKNTKINVVIDDFIGTGETLNAVWEGMNNMGRDSIDLLIIGNASKLNEWGYSNKPIVNNIITDYI